ncbi:MAG TPA: hypothetical protein VIC02_04745, partial [Kineobactrum sp.]
QADTLRYAVLPARQISISGAGGAPVGGGIENRSGAIPLPIATVGDAAGALLWPWQLLALVCALGWAATLIWYRPRSPAAPSPKRTGENRAAGSAFKQLQAACASNSAPQARRALLAWGRARVAPAQCESLATLTAALGDPDLSTAAAQLDQALYGDGTGPWEGAALLAAVSRQQRTTDRSAADDPMLELYPRGAR